MQTTTCPLAAGLGQLETPVKLSCQSPWSSVCLADEDLTAHGSLWLQCVLQLPVALVPSTGWQGTTALSVGVTVPGRALCSCPLLGHVPWVMSSASPSTVPSSCPCTYSARVSCSGALCGLPWELPALAIAMRAALMPAPVPAWLGASGWSQECERG